ncbi:hypothetical protein [Algoriphagus sediminis]|mgnify:CR=1 FL=1|uniref:TonB C-terminal domain-containing protein n=1 Tax=Algoriphagus sediminis TaxID=3057113 RepID=A0ABT7Y8H6_9BACT|nr:hypothetical protein [Algoriphagus sediminis]MDN3202801.1 hypothetical protein [Algoriphagus sediminis]
MNKSVKAAILMVLTLLSCQGNKVEEEKIISIAAKKEKPYRWVDDIQANPDLDNPSFEVCYSDLTTKQYFNLGFGTQYEGERPEIYRMFEENYTPVDNDQSGWIRIRFIVNCKGETGRFRVLSSDENYNEMEFDPQIINQLLDITKSMDGWKILPNTETPIDYYQYLIFKMDKGKILEILP